MKVGKLTDSYGILNTLNTATVSKTGSAILNYATSLGYNSVLLFAFGYNVNFQYYTILMCNIVLDTNNDIWLYEYEPLAQYYPIGVYLNGGSTYDRITRSTTDGTLQPASTTVRWTASQLLGKTYHTLAVDRALPEPVFLTTLQYNKVYLNNEDITPIEYNWKSVSKISGYFGELQLPVIRPESINGGNPVTGATSGVFLQLPDEAQIRNLAGTEETIYNISNEIQKYMKAEHYQNVYYNIEFRSEEFTDWYNYPSYFLNVTSYPNEFYLGILIDETNQLAKFSGIYRTGTNEYTYNNDSMSTEKMQLLYQWLQGSYDDSTVNEDTGTASSWTPRHDTPIDRPNKPDVSAIETGFTSMYLIKKTEVNELRKLSSYMWSADWIDIVKKWFDDPSEVIVGITMFPIEPDSYAGTATEITAGGIQTDAKGHMITDQYRDVNFGTLHVDTAGDNFLDYEPFTKVTAVLPYCGEHSLSVSDVMDKTLELHYLIDFYSGACVAYILVDGSCNYIFAGQMGNQIPISKSSYNNMVSSILSSGVSIGGALATMASGGMTAPIALGVTAANITNNMNMHPEVSFNSGGGGTSGMIGVQEAYIRFEEPIPKKGKSQDNFLGLPAYQYKKLSACSGFTKCLDVHLESIAFCPDPEALTPVYYPATANEVDEIYKMLQSGVLIYTGTDLPDLTPSSNLDSVIWLTNTSSEKNVIGKTFDATGAKIEGKLLNNQSISHPKYVIISGVDIRKYNYAYIPEMHRFYYIDDIELTNGDIYVVTMRCDVLNSFKDSILDCDAILERQKSITNKYFNDSTYWTQQNKNTPKEPFHDSLWNNASFANYDDCYILTVAGS